MPTPVDSDRALAWVRLYDAVSAGFAYPDAQIFGRLCDGGYVDTVAAALTRVGAGATLAERGAALCAATAAAANRGHPALAADYVALFEMRRDAPAFHPHAHLYDPDRRSQVALRQALAATYARYALAPVRGPRAEPPDHITVQLEFMGYLLKLRHRAAQQGDYAAAADAATREFHRELRWIVEFAERLAAGSDHCFYVPLARFTASLVDHADAI